MPSYPILSYSGDRGYLSSNSGTYATARAMGSVSTFHSATANVGQKFGAGSYTCYEGFVAFDTSVVPSTEPIVSVRLELTASTDNSTTDFTVEARTRSWMPSLGAADAVAGASLSGQTLLASLSTVGLVTGSTYNTFSSQAALIAAINLSGYTEMLLCSDQQTVGTQPVGDEYVLFDVNTALLTVTTADINPLRMVTSPMRW